MSKRKGENYTPLAKIYLSNPLYPIRNPCQQFSLPSHPLLTRSFASQEGNSLLFSRRRQMTSGRLNLVGKTSSVADQLSLMRLDFFPFCALSAQSGGGRGSTQTRFLHILNQPGTIALRPVVSFISSNRGDERSSERASSTSF